MSSDLINLLKKLVSINSIFPEEEKIGDFLFEFLKSLGFSVRKQYLSDSRFNLLAEKGKGKNSYLFYAHLDTVPIYGDWKEDPFKLRVEGDKAIGLGAADMKSGIVAILEAIKNYEPKNYKLKVAFGVDEENYSAGAYKLIQDEYIKDIKGVWVPESPLPFHINSEPGKYISIGRRGRAVFDVKIYGRSVHAVNASIAINAIDEAAKLIIKLKDFPITKNKEMGDSYSFISGFNSSNSSLSIPDYAEFKIDFHTVIPDNSLLVKERLERFIKKLYSTGYLIEGYKPFSVELSERPTQYLEPFIVDTKSPLIEISTNSVKNIYGEFEYNYGQSVADENVFGFQGIPTFTIGPKADNHHSAEEWVSIESMNKLSKIYRHILESLDDYETNN